MIVCPNCETENSDDARFCDECGFPLSGSIARAAGAASPARVQPSYQYPAQASRDPYPFEKPPVSEVPKQPQKPTFSQPAATSIPTSTSNSNSMTSPWGTEVEKDEDRSHSFFEETPSFTTEAFRSSTADKTVVFGNSTVSNFDDFHSFPSNYETPEPPEFLNAYQPAFDIRSSQKPTGSETFSFKRQKTEAFDDTPEEDYIADTIELDHAFNDDEDDYVPRKRNSKPQPRKSFKAPTRKGRFTNKQKGIIIGGILVVVVSLIAVIGFAFGLWGGVAVPNVVGMTQEEATKVLEDDGFTVKALQVKSDEIEGRVLVMDPGAGSLVAEDSEIVIHIATARTIPQIVGETVDEAKRMLEDAGYTNVKYETEFTDGEENIVVSVSPEADTRAKSSIEVIVKISENYKVPDVSGQSLEEAQNTIKNAGLTPLVVYIDTDQYPDGSVIGTDPGAGTKVSEGESVSINVARARGVELVALAEDLLAEGETVEIGGVNYQIESVSSLSYQGDDVVAFTVTAKPFVTFFGETLFASSSQTLSGSIIYSPNNEVISIG